MSDVLVRQTSASFSDDFEVGAWEHGTHRLRAAPYVEPIRKHKVGDIRHLKYKRRANSDAYEEALSQIYSETTHCAAKIQYPRSYHFMAYLVFGLLALGFIGSVIKPNAALAIGIPLGFTLWAVLYLLIRKFEQDQSNPRAF